MLAGRVRRQRRVRFAGWCDVEGTVFSEKQAAKAIPRRTSHKTTKPQLEWPKKEIKPSKFMTLSLRHAELS